MTDTNDVGHTRWAIAEGYVPAACTRLDSRQAENALLTTIAHPLG